MIDTNFHFHEWAFLAKVDPEAFEIRRRKTLDQFLQDSSDRQRMLGKRLQREIDTERRLAGNPQLALAAISTMLWRQASFLCDGLNDLSDYMKELERANVPGALPPAELLPSQALHPGAVSLADLPAFRS